MTAVTHRRKSVGQICIDLNSLLTKHAFNAALEPKKNNELDELARKNKELADRSKNRRTDYKLVGSDIIKTDPEPLPSHFKEQIREMLESRISTDTSSLNQNDRSGYVTDASSATWQFNNSFSPRSVVSLNGAKAEDATGLLKVRTTTAPPEDDKPRSIMKRSQLESREQMTYAEPERRIVREAHSEVVRAKPKVTETVETVEDHKRTEEIERRIIRRERRHRSSRHRYGHGQHEYVDWNNGGEERQQRLLAEEQQRRSLIEHQQRQRSLHEAQQRSLAKGLQQQRLEKRISEVASGAENRSVMHHKVEKKESYERSSRRMASQGSQTVANREKQTALRRYDGRRYTSEELNQAVKRAYQAVDKAHSDIRQWRSNSMQRSGGGQQNGYLPAYESYHRSTSTRRDRERDHGDYSRAFDNSGLAHARYGSLSDSLRRGELRYVPNGDFRENYGRSNKMHKSYSSRDVFNDGTRDSSWHRGSVGQGGQGQQAQGPAPVVEFPPTLPRQGEQPPVPPPHRGFSDNNSIYRPIVKSRSYADWDEPRFWKPQNPL
uniref:CCDC66 domain-containing protein n=1 Tax=Panagrellus redivivus TaxID=6233 RepID=A0A7E4VV32_PANRE